MSAAAAEQPVARTRRDGLTTARLLGVLLGRREDILIAARDRGAVWVGLILVFAAAFAREYDSADLAKERPSALLCYEADPAECHRRILTDRLADQGFEVADLRIPL